MTTPPVSVPFQPVTAVAAPERIVHSESSVPPPKSKLSESPRKLLTPLFMVSVLPNSMRQFLTPDMAVIVTTKSHTTSPFNNGAEEVQEVYMHIYGFDYKKAGCSKNDFDVEVIG